MKRYKVNYGAGNYGEVLIPSPYGEVIHFEEISELLSAAIAWWEAKRLVAWNCCTEAEQALAIAVARHVQENKPKAEKPIKAVKVTGCQCGECKAAYKELDYEGYLLYQQYIESKKLVSIVWTDEAGVEGYSVAPTDNPTFWLAFFKTRKAAVKFAKDHKLPVKKEKGNV